MWRVGGHGNGCTTAGKSIQRQDMSVIRDVVGPGQAAVPSVDVERCYTVIMDLNRPTDGTIKTFLKNNHWIRHLA